MKKSKLAAISMPVAAAIAVGIYLFGFYHGQTNQEPLVLNNANASKASPVKAVIVRDVYYPGSEDLGEDEMRVIACGTGMPNARPKQAAACFLVSWAMATNLYLILVPDQRNGSRRC